MDTAESMQEDKQFPQGRKLSLIISGLTWHMC